MLTVKSKQAWMKSAAQMKLNPSPNLTKSDFITQVISSIEDGFIPSDRTDLVEKERQVERLVFLFLAEKERFELSRRLPDLRP